MQYRRIENFVKVFMMISLRTAAILLIILIRNAEKYDRFLFSKKILCSCLFLSDNVKTILEIEFICFLINDMELPWDLKRENLSLR